SSDVGSSDLVADRLRWANRRRLDFRGYPVKVRLARLLVELATTYGHPVDGGAVLGCRLTQPELAALTGAAETTVHKGLRELRDEGLLETGYGSTVIHDLPRLRHIADLAAGEQPRAEDGRAWAPPRRAVEPPRVSPAAGAGPPAARR